MKIILFYYLFYNTLTNSIFIQIDSDIEEEMDRRKINTSSKDNTPADKDINSSLISSIPFSEEKNKKGREEKALDANENSTRWAELDDQLYCNWASLVHLGYRKHFSRKASGKYKKY